MRTTRLTEDQVRYIASQFDYEIEEAEEAALRKEFNLSNEDMHDIWNFRCTYWRYPMHEVTSEVTAPEISNA